MFCATGELGISWQYLYHLNLLARITYQFHEYIHGQTIPRNLGISLPPKDSFGKVKNSYIKNACCSI